MEIGRIKYTTKVYAYFTDGKVLLNQGFGWKLKYKVKDGINPRDVYEKQLAKHDDFERNRPALAAYRKELHAIAGMGKAWKLHAAVQMLDNDPDGVWSEACDGYGDNVHADIDEVSNLCILYGAAMLESKQAKEKAIA